MNLFYDKNSNEHRGARTSAGMLSFLCVCALAFFACSPEAITVDSGKKAAEKEADGNAKVTGAGDEVIDMEKTCGIKKAAPGEDPDRILFSINLKSLPVIIQGSQMGLEFKVTTTVTQKIEGRAKSGAKLEGLISVDNVEVSAKSQLLKLLGPIVAKAKATDQAKQMSGPVQNESLPSGQWLNLVTEGGQFKDLLCGIAPAIKKQVNLWGGKEAVLEWVPGLPLALNPNAPRETFEKEIGSGRNFQITSKLTKTKDGWPKIGEYPTTVTIKPREPTFAMSDGKTYAGDIAFEIAIKANLDPKFKGYDPISSTRSYFINLKERTFEAIVDTSQAVTSGVKNPVVVLLRQ